MDAKPDFTFLSRGFSLFLSTFSLLNLVGQFRSPNFDATIWWLDLRPFPPIAAQSFILLLSLALLAYTVRPRMHPLRRVISLALIAIAGAFTIANIAAYYSLLIEKRIDTFLPIPLSLFIAIALALIFLHIAKRRSTQSRPIYIKASLTAVAGLFAFPLMQMLCFGSTDYARPADAIVVFGARTHADGHPSQALADRVNEACDLYRRGVAKTLIFSGGPGDGAVHETEAMRALAIDNGVRLRDIILDPSGLNTAATVANTSKIFDEKHFIRIIAVSHFYHLPRIKMTYQRAGREVFTVPVREPLVQTPKFMLREIAALWLYYLRAA